MPGAQVGAQLVAALVPLFFSSAEFNFPRVSIFRDHVGRLRGTCPLSGHCSRFSVIEQVRILPFLSFHLFCLFFPHPLAHLRGLGGDKVC